MFSIQSWLSGVQTPEPRLCQTGNLPRFAAMSKLVDEREFSELGNQAGFDSRLLRKLRTERRRVYSMYLAELVAEFRSLVSEALDRAANDPGVDPGFLEEVLRVKTRFEVSVWLLRASLWLPSATLPRIHRRTLDLLGSMKSQLLKTY